MNSMKSKHSFGGDWVEKHKRRLLSWEKELDTNANGFAHLAPQVVAKLKKEIKDLEDE